MVLQDLLALSDQRAVTVVRGTPDDRARKGHRSLIDARAAEEAAPTEHRFTLTFDEQALGVLGARAAAAKFSAAFRAYTETEGTHPFTVHGHIGDGNQLVVEVAADDVLHEQVLAAMAALHEARSNGRG